jgi:hypothetical protein
MAVLVLCMGHEPVLVTAELVQPRKGAFSHVQQRAVHLEQHLLGGPAESGKHSVLQSLDVDLYQPWLSVAEDQLVQRGHINGPRSVPNRLPNLDPGVVERGVMVVGRGGAEERGARFLSNGHRRDRDSGESATQLVGQLDLRLDGDYPCPPANHRFSVNPQVGPDIEGEVVVAQVRRVEAAGTRTSTDAGTSGGERSLESAANSHPL